MSSDRAERSEGDKGAPLADALRVLRDRWLLVVAVVVVCTGGALALSLSSQKQYQATSELLFRPNQLGQAVLGTTLVSGSVDPTRDSATNQGLVHSSEVAQSVANRTKLGLSASQLLDKVSVQS